jgi:hypothetical protein
MVRHRIENARLESPDFLEIVCLRGGRTLLLPRGLPYHIRSGERMLDSLLVCPGETARSFRLAVGMNLQNPAALAQAYLLPRPWPTVPSHCPDAGESAWLLHVDAAGVMLTSLEAIRCEVREAESRPRQREIEQGMPDRALPDSAEPGGSHDSSGNGAVDATRPWQRGLRIRLLETHGHGGRVTVETFRPLVRARQTDLAGRVLRTLSVDGPRVGVEMESGGLLGRTLMHLMGSPMEARWPEASI